MSIATHRHTPAADSQVNPPVAGKARGYDRGSVENAGLVVQGTQMRGALKTLTKDNADLRQTPAKLRPETSRRRAAGASLINADRARRVRSMLTDGASRNP
jgi:hypothetical protein